MTGIYKRIKYIFTTFCKIFVRIKYVAFASSIQKYVNFFPVHLVDGLNVNWIFTISGEASLWGSNVYNKNPN